MIHSMIIFSHPISPTTSAEASTTTMATQDAQASVVCQSHKNSLTDGWASFHWFPLQPCSSTHGPLLLRSIASYSFTLLIFPGSCKSIISWGLRENIDTVPPPKPLWNCSSSEMFLWRLFTWHQQTQCSSEVLNDFSKSFTIIFCLLIGFCQNGSRRCLVFLVWCRCVEIRFAHINWNKPPVISINTFTWSCFSLDSSNKDVCTCGDVYNNRATNILSAHRSSMPRRPGTRQPLFTMWTPMT